MTDRRGTQNSRYDSSGNIENEFVDPDRQVLANKLGIKTLEPLQTAEEESLVRAYESLLQDVRNNTPMTSLLIKEIHSRIFGELYEWGGRWRTVWISKPGTMWPPPDFLEKSMNQFEMELLGPLSTRQLSEDQMFCKQMAIVQGEFLVIHPFREGNARTIKLMCDLVAAQTNRPPLLYGTANRDRDAYIEAAKSAFQNDYRALESIIQKALADAKRQL